MVRFLRVSWLAFTAGAMLLTTAGAALAIQSTVAQIEKNCRGQVKIDTQLSHHSSFLKFIGTDIPEIRGLSSAVVEHLDGVDHLISRFLACGIVTQRRALAF